MQRLGERLFFDRGLSANNTLSCAMCHIPTQGYGIQPKRALHRHWRAIRYDANAPTLYNVVFKKFLFHDGRETDVAAQVWGHCLAPTKWAIARSGHCSIACAPTPFYGPAFSAAFPGEGVSMTTLGRAIAAYEATLLRATVDSTARCSRARKTRSRRSNGAVMMFSSTREAAFPAT